MSSGAEQDDLDRMLAASRDVRGRYRAASQEEPSSAVDDAIRAHARRAVGARPRSAASPFASSWRVPLSIAAVLVLSVTVTVMMTQKERHLPSADQPPENKSAPATPSPVAPAPPQPAKPLADAMQNAPSRHEPLRGPAAEPRKEEQLERDLSKAPAPPPALDETATRALKKQAEPFPAAPAAPPAPATQADRATSPGPEPKANALGESIPEQAGDNAAAGGADTSSKRGIMEQRGRSELKSLSPNAVDAQGKLREQEGARARDDRAAPQRQQAPAAAAEKPQAALPPAAVPWESSPQAWLRHIEMLVRDNRMTEAREDFKAFRQRYPSYPLPSEFPLREP